MTTAQPTLRDQPVIRELRVRAVNVPMPRPVHTSGGAVTSAPLLLLDLETSGGVTGCSYVFCYTPRMLGPLLRLFSELAEMIQGDPLAPLQIEQKLHGAFRLLGAQGLAGMALSGIDMAVWDALARQSGLSLARLLGGAPLPVPAYNSCGLGIIGAAKAGPEARELAAPGFAAIKVRLGYPSPEDDVTVVRAVRDAVGAAAEGGVLLMSDYNQSLSVAEAERRMRALEGEGLYWIEEPTRCDDYLGHARLRQQGRTPVQLGENCWGPHDMAKALQAGACDYFMPDVGKIGGVSGWLRAAGMAEPLGLPLSSHLYPEISAQLLSVTPTRHWLEYVDWANPILAEPLPLVNGQAVPSDTPGSGMAWDEAAVTRYQVTL